MPLGSVQPEGVRSACKIDPSTIKVEPRLIEGQEKKGPLYFVRKEVPVVGAQCASCNAIVWKNSRLDPVLCESIPSGVPRSGIDYREYYKDKVQRFLSSMAPCPACGGDRLDRYINNVNHPRF